MVWTLSESSQRHKSMLPGGEHQKSLCWARRWAQALRVRTRGEPCGVCAGWGDGPDRGSSVGRWSRRQDWEQSHSTDLKSTQETRPAPRL